MCDQLAYCSGQKTLSPDSCAYVFSHVRIWSRITHICITIEVIRFSVHCCKQKLLHPSVHTQLISNCLESIGPSNIAFRGSTPFWEYLCNAHLTISDPGVHNENSVVKSRHIVLRSIVWVDVQQILQREGQIWIIMIHTFCLQTNETNAFIKVWIMLSLLYQVVKVSV